MRRPLYLLAFCISLGVLFSCGDTLVIDKPEAVGPEESCQNFTIEEAMAVFSDEYDGSSNISDQVTVSDSPFVWESGIVVPVWKAAECHFIQGREESYVVPMLSSVRYYASMGEDGTLVRCDQNLIVSKNVNSGRTSLRIVFSIPEDDLKRSRPSSGFSGLLVYTDLSGKFMKIEKYAGGEMCDGVYFSESESEIAMERHKLFINRIMEGITVFKVNSLQIETRCPAPGDTVEYNDSINPSYCNGNCFPDLWWQNPDFDFENDTISPTDTTGGDDYPWGGGESGGGGGGAAGSGGNTRPPKNNGGSSDKTPIKPVDCSSFYGKPEYYERRYADYIKRYKNEDKSIYYIEYGLYYCNKFLDLKGSGKMSVDGNKWIDKTLVLLQEKLEYQVQSNPELEKNLDLLAVAAFKTHPEAYIEGGFLQLPLMDKLRIVETVRWKDLTSKLGREQINEVVKAQVEYYIKHPYERAFDAYYMMNNWDPIKQLLFDYCSIDLLTRSSSQDEVHERYTVLCNLLFDEIVTCFYDTVDGFDINY